MTVAGPRVTERSNAPTIRSWTIASACAIAASTTCMATGAPAIAAWTAHRHGTLVGDESSLPADEIGLPGRTDRRMRTRSAYGVETVIATNAEVHQARSTSGAASLVEQLGFPEGVVHIGDDLLFVDYRRSTLFRAVGHRAVPLWHRDGCGANGLLAVPEGLLVACYDSGTIALVDPHGIDVATIDRDDEGRRLEHPNDFAADAHGGVYVTTSGDERRSGTLHYRDVRGRLHRLASGIDFANGVAVLPDGSGVLVGESKTNTIWLYPIVADGVVGPASTFATLTQARLRGAGKGTPDGIRIDARGNVYVALFDGDGIAILDRDGRLTHQVLVPGSSHTSLALSADGRFIDATSVDVAGGAIFRVPNPTAPR